MKSLNTKWIAISLIALATAALVGCNKGGGSRGPDPVIDCLNPQNFTNSVCFNASRGRPGAPMTVGTFSRALPEWGSAVLNITDMRAAIALCVQAAGSNGASNGYANPSYVRGYNNGAVNNPAQNFRNVCMNIGTTIVTFHSEQRQIQNGSGAKGYVAQWRLYFIPAGVPVNGSTPVSQLQQMGPATAVEEAYITRGAGGGFQAKGNSTIFSGIDAGSSITVNMMTQYGPFGSGPMNFSAAY